MVKRKRMSKRMSRQEKKTVFYFIAGMVALGALFVIELSSLRTYPVILLASRCVFTLPVLYWTWLHKSAKELPVAGKALATVAFLLPWGVLVPDSSRIVTLLAFVMLVVLTVYTIRYLRSAWRKECKSEILARTLVPIAAMFLMIVMLFAVNSRFHSLDGSLLRPAYLPAWVITVGSVAGYVVFTVRRDKTFHLKEFVKTDVVIALVIVILTLGLTVNVTASLNYALDTSPSTEIQLTVLDKEVNKRVRRSDNYYFVVTVSGKKEKLRVTAEEYRSYEIGDLMSATMQDGAFGIPYLILDKSE
jgi:hypothetical protein